MKKISLFLLLNLFLNSCSDSSNDYEDSIQEWLETNLNDPESYEPLTFEVLNSSYLEYSNSEFSNYSTAIQRRSDLLNMLQEHFKKRNDSLNAGEIYSLNDSITKEINSIRNFEKIRELNQDITQKIENTFNKDLSSDVYYLTILSQIESTNARIESDENIFENNLKAICLSDNPLSKLKNGLLIKHRFRANNTFGAKIINERIFELNADKSSVLRSCEIE